MNKVALVFVIMDESMRVLGWRLPWFFLGEVTRENWKETQSGPTRCSSRTLPRRSSRCAREFVMALRPVFTAFAWFQFASQRAIQMALKLHPRGQLKWCWSFCERGYGHMDAACCGSLGLQCKGRPEFSTFRSYPDYKVIHKWQTLLHIMYRNRWQVLK
jgi:hypothetical protein